MKKIYWLSLILILGFLLRFFYIYLFIGFKAPPESHGYWLEKVGYNLSQGEGFGSQPNIPTAKKPPMYPAFLAFIYFFFGHNFIVAKLGHILLALITCFITFKTAEKIAEDFPGLSLFPFFSSLLLAVIPTYTYISGLFLTENLCVLFSLLMVYFLIKTEKYPSLKNQILSGIFLGLTNLTRPNFASFLLIIPFWAFLRFPKKEALKIFCVITLTTLTVISPWMIRNWKIYNGFIPIATGGGRMFLAGNNPKATGDAILVSGSPRLYFSEEIPQGEEKRDWTKWKGDSWQNMYLSDLDSENSSSGLSEKEADKKYYLQGLNWIKGNKIDFVKLLPQKIYRFWQYWSPHTRWPDLSADLKTIDFIFYIPFLLLAGFGLILSFSRGLLTLLPTAGKEHAPTAFFTLHLILIYSQIMTLISFGDARQRFLFLPFLAIFAGLGLEHITIFIKQKTR